MSWSFVGASPLPLTLLLLWLTLPGIWLGACAFTEMLPTDRVARRALRPAMVISAWIVAVQIASMAAKSFWFGLPAGMIFLSVAGFALWLGRRNNGTPVAEESPIAVSRGMWLGMSAVAVLAALLAFKGYFHDMLLPNNGHMDITAQLQNDYFPPRYIGFTNVPLRYHYGSDLLAAGSTALARLRVDWAIDIVLVCACCYFWCLLWLLGQRLTGTSRGGVWTALATLFGGGATVFFAPFLSSIPWIDRLIGTETFEAGMAVNPPLASIIFQRPFTLGLPLATAVLLTACKPLAQQTPSRQVSRQVLLWLLLAALSLSQTALFVSLSATLAFTELVLARRSPFLLTLAAAWGAAWLMGGMLFTHVPNGGSFGFDYGFWPNVIHNLKGDSIAVSAVRVFAWHVATFGALLPLGVWGLWHVCRMRAALVLLAIGGVAVPLFVVVHPYMKNISKFSTVAALAFGILAGAALTWLANRQTLGRRAALVACAIALMASPVVCLGTTLWILFVGREVPKPTEVLAIRGSPVLLTEEDQQAVRWLRRHVLPDQIIYRFPETAIGYCQWGGLPATSAVVRFAPAFGISEDRLAERRRLLEDLPANLDAYIRQGIVWFVVGPDDPRMERNVRNWRNAGEVVEKAEFGALQIYKVPAT
jgi:hypothetical protein